MSKSNENVRFHCKDCSNFGPCQHYPNRKGTSTICTKFQRDIKTDLEGLKEEIERLSFNATEEETENLLTLIYTADVLETIEKYCGDTKEKMIPAADVGTLIYNALIKCHIDQDHANYIADEKVAEAIKND